MLFWEISEIRLDLKYTWKISRNASDFKLNSLVTVSNGRWKGMGEGAPNIRYQETPELMKSEFARFVDAGAARVGDLNELELSLNELKLPNALRFAIESAYVHYLCHAEQMDIYTMLQIPQAGVVPTSFSLPIMEVGEIEKFYNDNGLSRFRNLKIKINADNAVEMLNEVHRLSSQPLIIDANEAWKDPEALLGFLHTLKPFHIAVIEQPMPAGMDEEYFYLKQKSPFTLMADESICADADFEKLSRQFHGINMKLMKTGGYLNGIRLLNEARAHNMKTMVGCMIETSLGIASAFHCCAGADFVDLDGFLIIKDEPYHLVKEENGMLSLTGALS